ncbi:hypothetical protein LTR53_009968 [Teratosphaeriaceae sp. CCFEE 6253]|nr:hypothetical protein LTR53_009968 [Teratosphaeriaceae sp. CCFEE 6253]
MTDAPSVGTQIWNALQYQDALAHLERLQEQLDGLRSTLPSLVAPLLRSDISKPEMFASIKKVAIGSASDLRAFREDFTSDRTQGLLARSKESLQKDGDLSKANEVARYGWLKDDE